MEDLDYLLKGYEANSGRMGDSPPKHHAGSERYDEWAHPPSQSTGRKEEAYHAGRGPAAPGLKYDTSIAHAAKALSHLSPSSYTSNGGYKGSPPQGERVSIRGSVSEMPRDPSTEQIMAGPVSSGPRSSGKPKLCGLGVTFKKSDGRGGMVVKRVKTSGSAASSDSLRAGDRVDPAP